MQVINQLQSRGLLYQVSDPVGVEALPEGSSFYLGFDPTSPLLHIGHLVPLAGAIRLARAGFSPIILFGGATGSIGDPSGRSTERPLLTREEIDENVRHHKQVVTALFNRAGVIPTFVNNYEWTAPVSVLEFLRDVGKHFSVNYMLAKDSVKSRLEGDGISFTEMSYMLLQAFDFYMLNKTKGCRMQVGASDQFGNMTAGLELIRKKGLPESYVLSFPLLTDASGKKFGKSTGGALWLNGEATSPYRFHQYWINLPDADMEKYLKFFSLKNDDEITRIISEHLVAPEKRLAQRELADEMCTLVHGQDATEESKKCAQALFGGDLAGLSAASIQDIFAEAPSTVLSRDKVVATPFIDLFAQTGLSKSKSEARRLIGDGGGYINNIRIQDVQESLTAEHLLHGRYAILRAGKKAYHLIDTQLTT